MKRLLYILFVLAAALTIQTVISDVDEPKQTNNITTLDIPLQNQAHKYSSREFTAPTSSRTITHYGVSAIPIIASYTLSKRVNNISSHFTHYKSNTGSHKYISYGILRV